MKIISVKQWYANAISKIRTSRKPPSQEELQCHDAVIFYNFVFDIGKPVNPTQAARELLKKDFARASANHVTDTIEIAPRLKKLLDLREKAILSATISSYLQQHKWKTAISCVLQHPRHIWFMLKGIRVKIVRGGKQVDASTSPPQPNIVTDLKETVRLIDQLMADFQKFEGLQLYSDKQLFSPLYLREAPFVRVGLQPFVATIDGEDIGVDVSLVYVDKSLTPTNISEQFSEAAGSYNAALDLIHAALWAESEGERYTGVLRRSALAFALRV